MSGKLFCQLNDHYPIGNLILVTQELEERARVLKQQLAVKRQGRGLPMSDTELSQLSGGQKERFSEWDYPDDASLPPGSVSESSRSKSRDFRPEIQYRHPKTRTLSNQDERTHLAIGSQSPVAMSSAAVMGPDTVKHRSRSYNPDRGKDSGYPVVEGGPRSSRTETVPSQRSHDHSRSREPSYSPSMSTATAERSQKSRMHGRDRGDWTGYPSSAASSKQPGSYSEPTSPQSALALNENLPSNEKQQLQRKHDAARENPERHGRSRRRGMYPYLFIMLCFVK